MDEGQVKHQVEKFETARRNLLMVVGFTGVNFVFQIVKFDLYFLFSAALPLFFQATGNYVAALAIFALYVLCWYFSAKLRFLMPVALGLFLIDTVFLLLVMLGASDTSMIIDLAFHAFVLYYLAIGTSSWWKLRKADNSMVEAMRSIVAAGDMIPDGVATNDSEERGLKPLRADEKKGRILISAQYGDLNISMKRSTCLTELIVNGQVYDDIFGVVENDYDLYATVDGVAIKGSLRQFKFMMYLYVDGELLAKKARLF